MSDSRTTVWKVSAALVTSCIAAGCGGADMAADTVLPIHDGGAGDVTQDTTRAADAAKDGPREDAWVDRARVDSGLGDARRDAFIDARGPDADGSDAAPDVRIEAGPRDGGGLDASPDGGAMGRATCPNGEPPAFPSAEGFGACTKGGRGGKVLRVTTLAASGAGSLQAALDQKGPRTIVFDVSGVIAGTPTLTHGEVTLAGQTSPGGVILRGLAIQGDTVCESDGCPLPTTTPSDVIVRHLRLRPAGGGDDGLRLHRARRVVVDHVSIGNASDEAVQISMSSDISIQYTLLAESTVDGHDVEYGGMLLNYSDPTRGFPLSRLSIHHNVWNRIAGRLPEMSRENHRSDEGKTSDIEVSSNVYWDPRAPMPLATRSGPWSDGRPVFWNASFENNYFVVQPSYRFGLFTFGEVAPGEAQSIHMSGNRLSLYPTLTDWQLVYCCNDFAAAAATKSMPYANQPPPFAKASRHDFPPLTTGTSGEALFASLTESVGAFPRDPMDRRLFSAMRTRTFATAPLDQNPAGDALSLDFSTPPTAAKDTDGDGIPDDWERANGLDPNSASDGTQTTLSRGVLGVSGYTNLEVYLEHLSRVRLTQ